MDGAMSRANASLTLTTPSVSESADGGWQCCTGKLGTLGGTTQNARFKMHQQSSHRTTLGRSTHHGRGCGCGCGCGGTTQSLSDQSP